MSRSKIVCHSPADICFGCAHYQDPVSSPVCEYAGTYLVEMLRQGTGTTAMEYPEYRKAATRAADRLEQLEAEVVRLREALADSIRRPMGVIPASAEGLVSDEEIRRAEDRRINARTTDALVTVRLCERCGGQGWYAHGDEQGGGPEQVQCEACYGTGKEALATVRGEEASK